MPSISEKTVIQAPPDVVWPLLRDPEVVASCIPGAELSPDSGDGMWRGSIRVKFGPTVATFRGEAKLDFDDATKTCTVEGRGIDQRGASRARASGRFEVSGEQETTVAIEGEFNVTGPLETFANAGGVHVAQALLEEFSANLSERVAGDGASATPMATAQADSGTTVESGADQAQATEAPPAGAVESGASRQGEAATQQRAPAKEMSGFRLVWRVLRSMVSSLFGRKGQ